MILVVFTAAIGVTEPVRAPHVVDPTVQYLCFTDRPEAVPAPYEVIVVPSTESPRTASRRIKILADHPRLVAAEATLWHDASYRLTRTLRWVGHGLTRADLVGLRHPRRTLIEVEGAVIARYGYLSPEDAQRHVARYRAEGFAGTSITSSGLLARRVSPVMRACNACWWTEVSTCWGGRDQASLDYAAWRVGARIRHAPGSIRANRYAQWRVPPPVAPVVALEAATC